MPSIINSDDGVVSGTSGIKSTGGNDGILVFQSSGTETARITAAGNVGIGTNNPVSKLHIADTGNTTADGIRLTLGSEARDHNIYASLPTGRDLLIAPWRSLAIQTGNGFPEGIITLNGYEYVVIGTGPSNLERMRIDSSGNVGIGTSSPSGRFHVTGGNTYLDGERVFIGGSSNNAVINSNFSVRINIDADNTGTGESFAIGHNQTTIDNNNILFLVNDSGNVGVGTSSPYGKLNILASLNSTVPAFAIGEQTGTARFGIYQETSYTGIVLGNSNIDLKLKTYYAGGTGGVISFWTGVSSSLERARITSDGEFLVGTTTANSTTGITLRASGVIVAKGVYDTLVSASTRDIYMDSSGYFGYISSTRNSKTNIANIEDVSWLYALTPVSFNYKKFDRETNTHIDEADLENQYGLIAEDVEAINPDVCFYDQTENNQELRGVSYTKLITPMIKAIQELKAELDAVKNELQILKGN